MTGLSMQMSCRKASINRPSQPFYRDNDTYDTCFKNSIFTGCGVRDAWLDCPEKYLKGFHSKGVTCVILGITLPACLLNGTLLNDAFILFVSVLSSISIGSID